MGGVEVERVIVEGMVGKGVEGLGGEVERGV